MTADTTSPSSTEISAADARVAWELCIELTTRITTQPLPFRDGDEATALQSVADFFKNTRATLAKTPDCPQCAELVLKVLNQDIRPFTAKWHGKKMAGRMHSADERYAFRDELAEIQKKLVTLAEALADLASMPSPTSWMVPLDGKPKNLQDAKDFLSFGIWTPNTLSSDATCRCQEFEQINNAEWKEVSKRRLDIELGTHTDRKNAVGLALSGGGIRSATFSLGVLQSLAQYGLLKHLDFMSTVSGGGYLGSLISTHGIDSLCSDDKSQEPPALRYLRNHSKYLIEGGVKNWLDVIVTICQSVFTSVWLLLATLVAIGFLAVVANCIPVTFGKITLLPAVLVLLILMLLSMVDWGQANRNRIHQTSIWLLGLSIVLLALAGIRQLAPFAVELHHQIIGQGSWGYIGYAVLLIPAMLAGPNATGLHRYYCNRLARTFLQKHKDVLLSELSTPVGTKISNNQGGSSKATRINAPYHIINTAINVPDSVKEELRGRDSDVFILSKHYCGSTITGWRKTKDFNLTLATAMAISGAAASTHMGTQSRWHYRIPLGLLGLRLGYWLPWPKNSSTPPSWIGAGWLCFLRELTGWRMDENQSHLNLSDGGHIENLGIYELLRRRCRYIIAIDGECDPQHHFGGLLTLIRMAKIDMGIHIEPELADMRPNSQGLCDGHFTLARINYPKQNDTEPHGLLLYIKLSMTGDEPELLKSFRRENPDFPHQSTAQQLFSEAQFEAYRSLGEHIGEKLFSEYLISKKKVNDIPTWMQCLETALRPIHKSQPNSSDGDPNQAGATGRYAPANSARDAAA